MSIEDTSQRDPMLHLLGSLGDPSGYITGMEAAGQRQLLASEELPTQGAWDQLIEWGFTKGEKVDDLFVKATLPDGWKREGSDHAMHSYLIDPRGIRMVNIFYKAAFYDRSAHMHLLNPGYSAFTEVIYGDEPVALPEHWDKFTTDERNDFLSGIPGMEEQISEHPTIYGEYADRLSQLKALVA